MPSNTTLTGSAKTEGVKVDILGVPSNTTLTGSAKTEGVKVDILGVDNPLFDNKS